MDVWYIFVDYGEGMPSKPNDAECVEFGYWQFLVNKRAYRRNCDFPISTRKGRMRKSDLLFEWSDEAHRVAEAKAKVEYFETIIRESGPTELRLSRLEAARKALSVRRNGESS